MLRHRLKTLIMMFSLTAIAAALGSQVEIRTALLDMIKKSSDRAKVYDQMREIFGSDTAMLIGIEDAELASPKGIERLRKLRSIVEAQPLVHDVTSLVDLGLPVTMEDLDLALKAAFAEVFGPAESL